jgi:hypothetical protein
LDDIQKRQLGSEVFDLIRELEDRHKSLMDSLRVWWRNYEAEPLQKVKNFPFKNASNIIIPLAQIMTDAHVAETWFSIFGAGHRVWQGTTQNIEANEKMAKTMATYVNWQADGNDFNFRTEAYDWINEYTAMGSSVLAGNWRDEVRHVFFTTGGRNGKIQTQPISYNNGALLEHIPREQILWDPRCRVQDAPVVVREYSYSFAELVRVVNNDPESWDLEAVQAIKNHGGPTGPSANVMAEKAELDNIKPPQRQNYADHDIREVYLDWPVVQSMGFSGRDFQIPDVGVWTIPIVVYLHMKTKRVLRVNAAPYFVPYKPFFDGFYRKRVGRGHSVGLVKKLEEMQIAATTVVNQGIDSQTRANSVWGKTKYRSMLEQPIDPSKWIYDQDMKGVEAMALPGASFANIQLFQVIQVVAERLSGKSDVNFGRETRLGGHPAPATNTKIQQMNSAQLTTPVRDLTAQTLGQAGEFIASMDQQFEMNSDGKIEKVLGTQDGEVVKEFLFPREPIPGNYQFSIKGLSRDINPDQEMQKAIMVSQVNNNYWAGVLRATESLAKLLASPLPPEIKQINITSYGKYLISETKTHTRFLESAEIDDIENFVLNLEGSNNDRINSLDSFANQARELATAGQIPSGGAGVDDTGGTPGNGETAPFGPAG